MVRNFGLAAILILIFSAFVSSAAAQNVTRENSAPALDDASADSAIAQGIWKASLGEKEIIIAVNQSDQSLFGLAKYEGDDPWNAAVAGSISDSEVSLSLAALRSDALASICINAALQGETMKGFFVESDSNGMARKGYFAAEMISPNISGYSPASVAAAQVAANETEQTTAVQKNEPPASEEGKKAAQTQSDSRFKDVTQLAKGINPDILPRMASL